MVIRSRCPARVDHPAVQVLLLNTPHNPTGKVFTLDELLALSEIAIEHDLLVLTDEVYDRLTYGDAIHHPLGIAARNVGSHPDHQFHRQNIQHDWLEDEGMQPWSCLAQRRRSVRPPVRDVCFCNPLPGGNGRISLNSLRLAIITPSFSATTITAASYWTMALRAAG